MKLDEAVNEVQNAGSVTELDDVYQKAKKDLNEKDFKDFAETWAMFASVKGML